MGIAWGGFAAQVPLLKARIGAGDADFGVAMLIAAFGALLAMWIAPRLDRTLDARAMVVLAAVLALAYLSPGLALSVPVFAAAMLTVSALSGSLDVIMNARISRIEAQRQRPLMNFAHATFSIAYALAALLAGLAREAGWPPLATFAALGCLSWALCFIVVQDRARPAEDEDTGRGSAAPLLLWLGGGVILFGFMAEQSTEGWSALHLERNLGAGAIEGAFGPAILGLTMAVGRLGGQAMVHRASALVVIGVAAALSAAGAFLAASAVALPQAYIGFAALGLGVSVIAPMAYAYVGARVDEAGRTHAIARISVIGYTGFFIGPPLMGFASEGFGLAISFAIVGAGLAMITLVFVPALARLDRSAVDADARIS
ncbi:MFS transporter [Roseobacteraceae bacterium S113]